MVIIAVFCGILSIVISAIAVYQSEHFNKLSRNLNKDTKLMIDCNEKSISNLHVTLNEIINKEEKNEEEDVEKLEVVRNEMLLIRMSNYDPENKFSILHNIMTLSNLLVQKSISDLEVWMDSDDSQLTLKFTREITREEYKKIDIILEQVRQYGIWISFKVDLYSDIMKSIEEIS